MSVEAAALERDRDPEPLLRFITERLAEMLGQPVLPDANFGALGMDSLDAVNLVDALADRLGLEELSVSATLEHPSPRSLSGWLAAGAND